MPKPATDTWRVFIAVELPPEVRARLAQHVDSLRKAIPDVRASWARQENLHLTLKFLGEVPIAKVEVLWVAAASRARTSDHFIVDVGGGGGFRTDGNRGGQRN